jgi:hypothetical protein
MATRRHKFVKKNKSIKKRRGNKSKTGKKWVTAIQAASKTLEETGSIIAAKQSLKKQALFNARKLFGVIK